MHKVVYGKINLTNVYIKLVKMLKGLFKLYSRSKFDLIVTRT